MLFRSSTPATLTPAPALDTPSAEPSYYCPDDLQDSEDQVGVIPDVDAPPDPAPQQIQPQLAPDVPPPHRYPIRQRQPPGEWWRNATDRLRPRQPQVNAYREPTPVVESPPCEGQWGQPDTSAVSTKSKRHSLHCCGAFRLNYISEKMRICLSPCTVTTVPIAIK